MDRTRDTIETITIVTVALLLDGIFACLVLIAIEAGSRGAILPLVGSILLGVACFGASIVLIFDAMSRKNQIR